MVRKQAAHDVDPPLGETASYIKNEMTKEGYRHLLAAGKPRALGLLPPTLLHTASALSQAQHLSQSHKELFAVKAVVKPAGCV